MWTCSRDYLESARGLSRRVHIPVHKSTILNITHPTKCKQQHKSLNSVCNLSFLLQDRLLEVKSEEILRSLQMLVRRQQGRKRKPMMYYDDTSCVCAVYRASISTRGEGGTRRMSRKCSVVWVSINRVTERLNKEMWRRKRLFAGSPEIRREREDSLTDQGNTGQHWNGG